MSYEIHITKYANIFSFQCPIHNFCPLSCEASSQPEKYYYKLIIRPAQITFDFIMSILATSKFLLLRYRQHREHLQIQNTVFTLQCKILQCMQCKMFDVCNFGRITKASDIIVPVRTGHFLDRCIHVTYLWQSHLYNIPATLFIEFWREKPLNMFSISTQQHVSLRACKPEFYSGVMSTKWTY